jgi:hypothetical protein
MYTKAESVQNRPFEQLEGQDIGHGPITSESMMREDDDDELELHEDTVGVQQINDRAFCIVW